MIIAGVVIETAPGRAVTVAERLRDCQGLQICGNDGNRRLAGVWEAASSAELERSARELVRSQEDILGVYPTLVAEDSGRLNRGPTPSSRQSDPSCEWAR